jgi:hypothetical protein
MKDPTERMFLLNAAYNLFPRHTLMEPDFRLHILPLIASQSTFDGTDEFDEADVRA